MNTTIARTASLAVALLLLAACDPICGARSSPAALAQDLVFTGPVAGKAGGVHVDCRIYSSQAQLNASITGTLNSKPLALNVQVHAGYHGAGTYPVGSLLDGAGELRLQVGDFVASTTTGAGTLTIDAGGTSGSVDAALSGGEHVKGTFNCDEVHTA